MGHALHQVAHRACLQSAMYLFVAFICGKYEEARLRSNLPDGADNLHSTFLRQPHIDQRDVGAMLPIEFERLSRSARLRNHLHVGLRLNHRGDAETHDRMRVAEENSDPLFFLHCDPRMRWTNSSSQAKKGLDWALSACCDAGGSISPGCD